MRELVSTITTKGQVTIPVEIRRLLGVASHDEIAFLVSRISCAWQPEAA